MTDHTDATMKVMAGTYARHIWSLADGPESDAWTSDEAAAWQQVAAIADQLQQAIALAERVGAGSFRAGDTVEFDWFGEPASGELATVDGRTWHVIADDGVTYDVDPNELRHAAREGSNR